MCGFSKRNFLGLQNFLPPTQSLLVFAARSCGDFLALEPLAVEPRVDLGLLAPKISLLNFYPPHVKVGPACFTSPPLLPVDGCGFFNSIVVRLDIQLVF